MNGKSERNHTGEPRCSLLPVVLGVVASCGSPAPESPRSEQGAGADGATSSSLVQVEQSYVDPAGVINYAFDPAALPGAQAVEQTGTPDDSGDCTFEKEGSGSPDRRGPQVTVMREVTFDPKACTRRLAVARYSRSDLPASITERIQDEPDEALSTSSADPSADQSVAVQRFIGSIKVNVEDPLQIDVTSTKSRVEWQGGSCVSASWHNAYWGWYSPSGWRRTNSSWSYDRTCARAYTDTYGKYRNGVFCATIDTWTTHHKTWFEGRPWGGWAWSYKVTKSGGCTGLLHYEYIVETP